MKRAFHIFLITAFSYFIITGCSKGTATAEEETIHEINPEDTARPVIQVNKPTDNQVFSNGDVIQIEGIVTDLGLYRGKIKIVNDANGIAAKEQAYEIHGLPSYSFNLTHKISVSAASTFTVTVEFEDHGLNVSTKSIKIKVNP